MTHRGISIHVGLNGVHGDAYPRWPAALQAAEHDAAAMTTLAERERLAPISLIGAEATRARVEHALREAARSLRPGDLLVFTFSGHGAQFGEAEERPPTALNLRVDEDDGYDESWCLWDGFLLDDQLHDLLAEFRPGVRIFVLVDACHSGTSLRVDQDAGVTRPAMPALPPGARAIPPDRARAAFVAKAALYTEEHHRLAVPREIRASVLLLAACRDEQIAIESAIQGRFTAAVLAAWSNGEFHGDHAAFHAAVSRYSPDNQAPVLSHLGANDAAFSAQRPFTI